MRCNKVHGDLFEQYDPDKWSEESMLGFIQGKWLLDTLVCAGLADTCDLSAVIPADYYLSIDGAVASVMSLEDKLMATSEFTLDIEKFDPFYRIVLMKSPKEFGEWWGAFYGALIPCESTLVISTSFLDGADRYYRKID
jgi:hypothetical protein